MGEWRVGERVDGRYEVRQVLGRGDRSVLYRIRHLDWDTDLAVRRLRPEAFRRPRARQRFVAEARTWMALESHPHVARCYYARSLGGVPALFTEYLSGGSLDDQIDDGHLYAGGPVEVRARVLDVAVQIAWGLAHAHAAGAAHQAVRPDNVLFDAEGTAKLTDLGIAAAISADLLEVANRHGAADFCAAPEQLRGERADPRGDLWSLAASVLRMLLGPRPPGSGACQVLTDYRKGDRPDARVRDAPDGLLDLLHRCLRDAPDQRPGDAARVADQLVEVYADTTGRPYPRGRPEPVARADELTDRALALLDLGRVRNAEQALRQARADDPRHPEAAYNLGLLRWRNSEITDEELVADLAAIDSPRARALLARVHRERGDHAAARALDDTAPSVKEEAADRTVTLEGRWGPASSVGVTPDGRLALAVNRDGTARAWRLSTGRRVLSVGHRRHPVLAVCPTTDPRTALIAAGKTVLTWDLNTGQTRRAFKDPGGPVTLVSVTEDGHYALTSGVAERAVRVWDLRTGRRVRSFEAREGQVASVCAVPGTDLVLVAGLTAGDAVVRIWDLAADRRVGELPGETGPVTAVCATPDGRHAAIASGEPAVRVWDLKNREPVGELCDHSAPVVSMSVTDDRRHLLTASLDGRVRVWDLTDGRCLRTTESDRPMGMFVCAVPGSSQALLPGDNGNPLLWRWGSGAPEPFRLCAPRATAKR